MDQNTLDNESTNLNKQNKTARKMFSIKDFFSKCDQVLNFL